MNITQDQINDLYDAEVVTQDDDNLGGVGEVYLDDQTGEPSWVSVKTGWFGTNHSLVPLANADFSGGRIRVPYSKDVIKDAPNVDAEQHLSEQEQDELFRYYAGKGLDVSRYGRQDAGFDSTGTTTGTTTTTTGTGVGTGVGTDMDRDRGMGTDVDRDREGSVTLHEERADVGTERVETGRVRLRKHVVTDTETVTVPVEREEVELVREPVTGADARDGGRLGDEEVEVTLHEERPVVEKDVVATERVGLDKDTVTDEQTVVTDVSREEVEVDRDTVTERGTGHRGDGMDGDHGTRR